jgi:hypothetical protein
VTPKKEEKKGGGRLKKSEDDLGRAGEPSYMTINRRHCRAPVKRCRKLLSLRAGCAEPLLPSGAGTRAELLVCWKQVRKYKKLTE